MQTNTLDLWGLRLVTLLLAALAVGSTAYWGLRWAPGQSEAREEPAATHAMPAGVDTEALARFLSGAPATVKVESGLPVVSASSRFKLTGVVARPRNGQALIAIDGKPARPFRVGAPVTDDLVLHSVAPRSASLAPSPDGPVTITLELPKLARP